MQTLRLAAALLVSACHFSLAQLALDFEAPDLPPGCQRTGKVTDAPGHEGKGILCQELGHIRVPSKSWFDPQQGTIEFMVRPNWPAGDKKRHTFVHLGTGDAHVTIFRHDNAQVRFVYKANPSAWCSAGVRTGAWDDQKWHHVMASWKMTENDAIVLCLVVDGEKGLTGQALPLTSIPEWTLIGSRGPAEPADAVIDSVKLEPKFRFAFSGEPVAREVRATLDAMGPGTPMPRTFSFVTPWNSSTNRIPFTRKHPYFQRFRDAGFELVRLVAFSETWLWGTRVERGEDGKIRLDFSDFDFLLDMYRDAGAKPYVRLAYHMPKALASEQNIKGHNYSNPKSLDEWTELMRRIVTHCVVERKIDVQYWVTMLNEADIAIRKGETTWEPILDLYERTTRVVKSIDPKAKVGGPATCGPLPGIQEDDIRTFLRFCKDRDLPPDFLCFHAYRRARPRQYEDAILAVRRVVKEEWPTLDPEYILDEWNLWVNDSRQNNEYAAAYLAASVHYQMRAGLSRSSIVSFNSARSAEQIDERGVTRKGPFRKGDTPIPSARFYATTLEMDGTKRPALYTHAVPGHRPRVPYTFGRYRVQIPPEGCQLRTGTAQGIDFDKGDGCQMTVVVISGGKEFPVLVAHVHKRVWQEHSADLSPFAGKTVDIEFRTNCGANGNVLADHAVWGSPQLVVGDKPVYDFCSQIDEATTGYQIIPEDWYNQQPSLPLIKGNVLTPAYFTYWLLNRLNGERLPVALAGKDGIHESDTVGAIACRDGKTIRVLLWHFDPERADYAPILPGPETSVERQITLDLAVPPGSSWRMQRYLIDAEHSNAYTEYVRHQGDSHDGAYNLADGKVEIVENRRLASPDGKLVLPVSLLNLSVSLVELQPE